MKRYVKAARETKFVIFEDENFSFDRATGIGINHTPWEGYKVHTKTGSLAEKHVVEIRLNGTNLPKMEGKMVQYHYSDAYVAHGMRMKQDSLDETGEYIDVLEDALDFAYRVNDWLFHNDEGEVETGYFEETDDDWDEEE